MKILSFGHSISGCYWVRIFTPLNELSKKHEVYLTDGQTQYPFTGWDIVIFNNLLGDIEYMSGDKVIKGAFVKDMVEKFRSNGAKIVYDIDDAMEIHPHKDDFGGLVNRTLDSYWYLLKNADLVTVTTEHLKKHVSKFTHKPIQVLPNCINPDLFPAKKQENKVKIGFAGSTSHIPDLDIVIPSIEKMRQKYGIYFETLGFQKGFYKWKKPVPINQYYEAVADLGADIGICPLLDNEFNKNKSPLKFLEYSMVGTMVLASNRLPYKGEMKDEWLVDDNKWEETLEKYILDKDLRERTLKEQQEWILKNRDIKKEWKRWEKAYLNLVKNNINIYNNPELKIAPMPENAGDVLKDVCSKLKMPYWISAGTALGLYRDKDFIKGDTDLDIAMEGYTGVDNDVVKAIGGKIMRSIYDYQERPMQLAILKDGVLVDVYFHWRNGKNLENHSESGWTRMKADICLKQQLIKTQYGKLPFPQEEYFSIRYGEDWKTPQDKKPIYEKV